MFVDLGDFGDKPPSSFFENFEIALVLSGNFKIFKNALEKFIPNRTPKHVFTSRNNVNHFVNKSINSLQQELIKVRHVKARTLLL